MDSELYKAFLRFCYKIQVLLFDSSYDELDNYVLANLTLTKLLIRVAKSSIVVTRQGRNKIKFETLIKNEPCKKNAILEWSGEEINYYDKQIHKKFGATHIISKSKTRLISVPKG